MLFVSKIFRAAGVFVLLSAAFVSTFADTIRLKDGSVIKGKIVSFGGGKFVVAVGEGGRIDSVDDKPGSSVPPHHLPPSALFVYPVA